MFGASLVESNALELTQFNFLQIMFDTKHFCFISLFRFMHQNLHYIMDNMALLSTQKANPLPGESKGCYIIDVEKLLLTLGAELSLDYGHFTQAAAQMCNFQSLHAGNHHGGSKASAPPTCIILRTKAPQNSLIGNLHGPSSSRNSFYPQNQKKFASISISKINNASNIPLNASTSAFFAAPRPITL
jgi:hypothetical protein